MLYIIEDGQKQYLAFGTNGVLRLVSEEYKSSVVSNEMSMHQQLNELFFDIVAVNALYVTLPYAPVTENDESSGNEWFTF